ncbi:MAG: formylglycine-generating enzyme family protein [Chloroflexi bacterium]|nr:formylglycine-generating enzyme family protein [Chloroflexota bacterium]
MIRLLGGEVLLILIMLLSQTNASLTTAIYLTATPSLEAVVEVEVESNVDWTPYVAEFDDVEMVLVPQGCFMMGSDEEMIAFAEALPGGSRGWADHERPTNEVCFDEPFWIDRYEVTNAQFEAFEGVARLSGFWGEGDYPRERVTWFEARDFCALRDAHLPTEAEWEYAARGPDNLIYPWGNTYIADYAVADSTETTSVSSHPEGASWVGVFHLSGNVWEWTSTIFGAYPYQENHDTDDESKERWSLRGGAYWDSPFLIRSANRHRILPQNAFQDIGFRCARDYDEHD